jgi:competence protein ComEC
MTLFYLCISWMAGIALAPVFGLPLLSTLAAGACFFLTAFTLKKYRTPLLCLAFFLLGSARLSAAQPEGGPAFVGSYLDRSAVFEVVLEEDPVKRGSGWRARARVVGFHPGQGDPVGELEGAVLVEFRTPPEDWKARYGDRAEMAGFLAPPPEVEGFDYADYLARQGVYGILKYPAVRSVSAAEKASPAAALFAFRRLAQRTLKAIFPEPESALLAGILLGDESGIPADVEEAFSQTGITHIVAISGFNITIIAGLFLALAARLPRRIPGWLIAAIGIAVYTVLVGAAASVVRSALMGGLVILARTLGRRSHGLTSLGVAGAVMTAANPWTLWDIGFQLSFAAALGLILYADPLQERAERWFIRRFAKETARALASAAGEVFLMTFAAQITTLPLILFYFNALSLSAFLVNPLVLSVQPMVMIAGGLALLAGMAWLPAGQALAWAGWAPTAYTIRTAEWGAALKTLWWPIDAMPPLWILIYYGVLFAGTALSARGRLPVLEAGRSLAAKFSAAALPLLAAGAYLAWGAYFRLPDGRLHLTMLPGGGKALLLRTPDGGRVLIDGGGDSDLVVSGLGRILGFGPRRLDWIVIGSAAAENTSALAEIAVRFDIGGVLLPAGAEGTGRSLAPFIARCEEQGIPVIAAEAGYRLDLGRSASLAVMDRGEAGLILAVEYGRSRWLILDGSDGTLDRRWLNQGRVPGAQIIVFPLSIKKTGGLSDWLRAAGPLAGLWPLPEDLGWPEGIELLRADARGRVDLSTDGERLWVFVER